jgi:membrane protein DedA with SNARE-associated domain
MDYRMFAGFNLISSAFWGVSLLMTGYFFGGISLFSEYLGYFLDLLIVLMAVAIIVALVAFAYHYVKRNNDGSTE